MGIRSTLASLLTAPLATVLETRTREITKERLDEAEPASPAEVAEFDKQLGFARTALDELKGELATLGASVEAIADDDTDDVGTTATDELRLALAGHQAGDADLLGQIESLHSQVHALADRTAAIREQLSHAGERIGRAHDQAQEVAHAADDAQARLGAAAKKAEAPAPAEQVPPTKPAPAKKKAAPAKKKGKGCKVDGCDNKHRARGFCGRHYQMWKRNTLLGFVCSDDTVTFEEDGPTWQLAKGHTGQPARLVDGTVHVGGEPVDAERIAD